MLTDFFEVDRWHLVEQPSQAVCVRLWEHFGLGCQDLPQLEIKAPKIAKDVKDTTGCFLMLSIP